MSQATTALSEPEDFNQKHQTEAVLDAINRVQAVIEFDLDGIVLHANENFLSTLGYSLDEIKGQHHRMFCDEEYHTSLDYKLFWKSLAEGQFQSGEFKRVCKNGNDVWILASYNPVLDESGKPFKIVKFASDISNEKFEKADLQGKIDAIDASQATIEFDLDGVVLTANDNFLDALGYSLEEIKGEHHRMFCDESTGATGK